MSSRQQQKEQARQARIAAQEAQRAEERRKQRLRMLLGAVLAAAIAVIVAIVVSQSGTSSTAAPTPARTADLFKGIPQKGNVLGYPQAKVVLEEFGDLQCPVCRAFATETLGDLVTRYVATGKVRLVFNNLLIIGPQSDPSARTAIAAGQQGKLWQFIDRFYAEQQQENSGYVTDDFLRGIARGVPGVDVQRLMSARDAPGVRATLAAQQQRAQQFGFSATPSFLLYRVGQPPKPFLNASLAIDGFAPEIDKLLARR